MKIFISLWIILSMALSAYSQDKTESIIHIIIDDVSTHEREAFIPFSTIRSHAVDSVSIDSPESVTMWTGVRLCEFFKTQFYVDCQDIVKLTISADDGYSSVISDELLRSIEDGLCAFPLTDSSPWDLRYGYMRIIFPDLRRMYWVNNPTRMIIKLGAKREPGRSLIFRFLDNKSLTSIIKHDLNHDPYFAYADIVSTLQGEIDDFTVVTRDTLVRDYHVSDEISQRLLFHRSQDGGWAIDGVDVPLGLKTREIIAIIIGNAHVFMRHLSDREQKIWSTIYFDKLIDEDTLPTQGIIRLKLTDYTKQSRFIDMDTIDGLNFYQLIETKFRENEQLDYIEWIISWI